MKPAESFVVLCCVPVRVEDFWGFGGFEALWGEDVSGGSHERSMENQEELPHTQVPDEVGPQLSLNNSSDDPSPNILIIWKK